MAHKGMGVVVVEYVYINCYLAEFWGRGYENEGRG